MVDAQSSKQNKIHKSRNRTHGSKGQTSTLNMYSDEKDESSNRQLTRGNNSPYQNRQLVSLPRNYTEVRQSYDSFTGSNLDELNRLQELLEKQSSVSPKRGALII